eukprot:GGOE01021185.1.p1 GENE.GGOE01021185.1~~GGOE01021185.1.p1  ORF type:complete len:299 (+),score=91.41 GGOE01021185.1:80-976(+)
MVGHSPFTADTKAEGSFSTKAKSSTAAVVGGLISGPIDAYLLQPTDVVKTKQQMSTASAGMLRTGRDIVREEGVTALWKGATPFATHLALKYCLRWGSATHFINLMRDDAGRLTSPRIFAAGAMAGALEAVAIVTPFEVVKTRLQVQKAHTLYRGPVDVVQHILRHEGPRGFWRGLAPTFTRNTMNQAANQLSKPLLDKYIWGLKSGDTALAAWQSATTGFIAGIVGPLFNNPVDVSKTRLMSGDPRYHTMLQTIVRVGREEGVRQLWKGYVARLARIGPGYAVQWAVVDAIQQAWPW